jgi:energy-coupling factor transporter ATP-binding protein EcfA2
MAQPGSSTITQSPGRNKVRLMMSSAWVAPTVVIITHDRETVEALADRVATLEARVWDGRGTHASTHGGD